MENCCTTQVRRYEEDTPNRCRKLELAQDSQDAGPESRPSRGLIVCHRQVLGGKKAMPNRESLSYQDQEGGVSLELRTKHSVLCSSAIELEA